MAEQDPIVECAFMVPLVQNTNKEPHPPRVWDALDDALYRSFGGSTSERLYQAVRPLAGQYRGNRGDRIHDESVRFLVATEERRIGELRALLRKVANSFDQECIYFAVRGAVEYVVGAPEDGFLTDD